MLERDLRLQRSSPTNHDESGPHLSQGNLQDIEDLLNSNLASLPLKPSPDGMNSGDESTVLPLCGPSITPQDSNTSTISLKRPRSHLIDDHTILRSPSHHVQANSESPPRTRQRCESDASATKAPITSQSPPAPASGEVDHTDQSDTSVNETPHDVKDPLQLSTSNCYDHRILRSPSHHVHDTSESPPLTQTHCDSEPSGSHQLNPPIRSTNVESHLVSVEEKQTQDVKDSKPQSIQAGLQDSKSLVNSDENTLLLKLPSKISTNSQTTSSPGSLPKGIKSGLIKLIPPSASDISNSHTSSLKRRRSQVLGDHTILRGSPRQYSTSPPPLTRRRCDSPLAPDLAIKSQSSSSLNIIDRQQGNQLLSCIAQKNPQNLKHSDTGPLPLVRNETTPSEADLHGLDDPLHLNVESILLEPAPDGMNSSDEETTSPLCDSPSGSHNLNPPMVSLKRRNSQTLDDCTILRGPSHRLQSTLTSPPLTRRRCESSSSGPKSSVLTDSKSAIDSALLQLGNRSDSIKPIPPSTSKNSNSRIPSLKRRRSQVLDDHTILRGSPHQDSTSAPPPNRRRCDLTLAQDSPIESQSSLSQANQLVADVAGKPPRNVKDSMQISPTVHFPDESTFSQADLQDLNDLLDSNFESIMSESAPEGMNSVQLCDSPIASHDTNPKMVSSNPVVSSSQATLVSASFQKENQSNASNQTPSSILQNSSSHPESLKRRRSELVDDHTILRRSSQQVHSTSDSPPLNRRRCDSPSASEAAIKSRVPSALSTSSLRQANPSVTSITVSNEPHKSKPCNSSHLAVQSATSANLRHVIDSDLKEGSDLLEHMNTNHLERNSTLVHDYPIPRFQSDQHTSLPDLQALDKFLDSNAETIPLELLPNEMSMAPEYGVMPYSQKLYHPEFSAPTSAIISNS